MKTKTTYLFVLCLTLMFSKTFSQTPAIVRDWAEHIGKEDTLITNPIAYDNSGNVYIAGFTMNVSTGADIIVTNMMVMVIQFGVVNIQAQA